MFVDIADANRVYDRLGDARAVQEIDRRLALCRKAVETFSGQFIKSMGKGLLAVFNDADAAVDAAIEMQASTSDLTSSDGYPIMIRVGLQQGPMVRTGDDVFGDTVNVAARILELAAAGQVLASESTRAVCSEAHRAASRLLGRFTVKGKAEPLPVYEFIGRAGDDLTLMTRSLANTRGIAMLTLRLDQETFRLSVIRPRMVVGRSSDADIIVSDAQASRIHLRIELKNGKFVLTDLSTNGTTVRIGDATEVEIHREETILYGSGSIGFGRGRRDAGGEWIRFECSIDGAGLLAS